MKKLFCEYDLSQVLKNQSAKMLQRVEKYSNDEIMANDLEILADNCYEEFYIVPIEIGDEEFEKRSVIQQKIEVQVDRFWADATGRNTATVDGISMIFYYPYSGEQDLFYCRALTFSVSGYPNVEIGQDYICFHYAYRLTDMKNEQDKEKQFKQLERDLSSIKEGASFANNDVRSFNAGLRSSALTVLKERKEKVKQFYAVSSWFEVPVKKTDFAQNHLSVKRKITPITKTYDSAPNYYIADSEYVDILSTIRHNCCTYERTPAVYKSLREEDLRSILLASLNGLYQGSAAGEAFRNHGKTDICIEKDSRAAFIAECKIWNGKSIVQKALEQLDSYLTWRDCKTALIYFVRNKDFLGVIDSMKSILSSIDFIRQVKEIERNEFDCIMLSKSNAGQQVKVRVMLYNLYSD